MCKGFCVLALRREEIIRVTALLAFCWRPASAPLFLSCRYYWAAEKKCQKDAEAAVSIDVPRRAGYDKGGKQRHGHGEFGGEATSMSPYAASVSMDEKQRRYERLASLARLTTVRGVHANLVGGPDDDGSRGGRLVRTEVEIYSGVFCSNGSRKLTELFSYDTYT